MKKAASLLVLLVVTAAVVLAVAVGRSRRVPKVERVILLGFDGASPNLMEPLIEAGELPALARLMRTGSYGRLRSFRPAKSAVLWTTVATGKTMLKHGIVDWTYVNGHGVSVPFEDEGRRARTYWEVLGERGVTTGTINWWVTYPPRPVANGYVVSDVFRRRRQPDTVYPESLFDWLNALRLRHADVGPEMARREIPEWEPGRATLPLGGAERILLSYDAYFAQSVTVDRVSDYLFRQHPAKVFSTYFRLVDVTSHFADRFVDRRVYDEAAAAVAAGGDASGAVARLDREVARILTPVYKFMDRTVAKYVAAMDEHTVLIVCSDHGFAFFGDHYDHYSDAREAPDGILFLAGPGVRAGSRISGASLFDIAPSILHWMGQPVAADMDGHVLPAALAARPGRPVVRIATYESGASRKGAASADPSEALRTLEDLRTLGYIQGPPESTPAPPSSARP